ncbi:hypothetical protein GW17_00061115, partial [Ensete ventricosum]
VSSPRRHHFTSTVATTSPSCKVPPPCRYRFTSAVTVASPLRKMLSVPHYYRCRIAIV